MHCNEILVDPDDMLKAALKLKGALILRCGGMQLLSGQDEKGEWLKINYYDEEGTSVSERFRLKTPAQRKVFELKFLREHQRAPGVPLVWHNAQDIINQFDLLRYPDFIVAQKIKKMAFGKFVISYLTIMDAFVKQIPYIKVDLYLLLECFFVKMRPALSVFR